jgi:hypothetical protein
MESLHIPYFFEIKYGIREINAKVISIALHENNQLIFSVKDHPLTENLTLTLKKSV